MGEGEGEVLVWLARPSHLITVYVGWYKKPE